MRQCQVKMTTRNASNLLDLWGVCTTTGRDGSRSGVNDIVRNTKEVQPGDEDPWDHLARAPLRPAAASED